MVGGVVHSQVLKGISRKLLRGGPGPDRPVDGPQVHGVGDVVVGLGLRGGARDRPRLPPAEH